MAISNSITQIDTVLTTELPVIREALLAMSSSITADAIPHGVEFPTDYAENDLFFRDDFSLLCYRGTNGWYTVNEYQADLTQFRPLPVNTTGVPVYVWRPVHVHGIRLTRFSCAMYTFGPTSANNYLSLRLEISGVVPYQFTTATAAASQWYQLSTPLGIDYDKTAHIQVTIPSITGSPSPFYIVPSLWYRFVIT